MTVMTALARMLLIGRMHSLRSIFADYGVMAALADITYRHLEHRTENGAVGVMAFGAHGIRVGDMYRFGFGRFYLMAFQAYLVARGFQQMSVIRRVRVMALQAGGLFGNRVMDFLRRNLIGEMMAFPANLAYRPGQDQPVCESVEDMAFETLFFLEWRMQVFRRKLFVKFRVTFQTIFFVIRGGRFRSGQYK